MYLLEEQCHCKGLFHGMQTLLSPPCLWHMDCTSSPVCVPSLCTVAWNPGQPPLACTALTPPLGRAQRQAAAFPWRFNSSISYSVFLGFLSSNYSFKIITNFFLIFKFHLASYIGISCRERIQTIE